jgi:hypothetical protein
MGRVTSIIPQGYTQGPIEPLLWWLHISLNYNIGMTIGQEIIRFLSKIVLPGARRLTQPLGRRALAR